MQDDKLKVGLVGCGIIAAAHAPYVRSAGGELVGVADPDLKQANDLADRFQIQRVYAGADELLDIEKPDIVHVLTPPHTHAKVAIPILERGIHVLVEKPAALSVSEVDDMIAAAGRGGAMLAVDHNRLFDPPVLEARKLVDSGALGELRVVESFQAGNASERTWLSSLKGGGLGDLLPHPLYLQLAFLGEVDEVIARRYEASDGGEELRVLLHGSRCSGSLTISTGATPGLNTLKLCGTKMTVEVNLNNMTLVRRREYDVPKVIAKPLPNIDESWQLMRQTAMNTINFVRGKIRYYPGMGELIHRFYAAVREGGESPVSNADALAVVDVTNRIWADAAAAAAPSEPASNTDDQSAVGA